MRNLQIDVNEVDMMSEEELREAFEGLPEEPEVELDEEWIEKQIELSMMLRKNESNPV